MNYEAERVVNDDYRDVEEISEKPLKTFPQVEGEFVEEREFINLQGLERLTLNELYEDDIFAGKPILQEVEKVQFDPEEPPKYRARLLLVNEEDKEYLQINLNLKKDGDIQENVHEKSTLYALVGGIMNIRTEGAWTTQYNRIRKVDLSEFRDYFEKEVNELVIQVKTIEANDFAYNSFKVVGLS